MRENAVAHDYYNSHKQGELDFVVEHDNSALPIEVKSSKDYYVHSALSKVLSNKEYEKRHRFQQLQQYLIR